MQPSNVVFETSVTGYDAKQIHDVFFFFKVFFARHIPDVFFSMKWIFF